MNCRDLISLTDVPAYQNKMFDDLASALACPRGDVVLAQDLCTGLVHNRAYDPDLLKYDESYQNEQAHSPAFKAHVAQVLDTVGRQFRGMRLLEIGCGKGHFLDLLRADGHDARGIDPAYEGDSEFIVRDHFAPGVGVRGDAIVMRHVLEHIPQPAAFLGHVRDTNGGQGRIYIEVPCLDWILAHNAWFDIFYEHVNYFRLSDFDRLFGHVVESGHLFGGQYIFVIAELASLRDPSSGTLPPPWELDVPASLFASIDRVLASSRPGKPRAIWGAAAKGVMFAHHMASRGKGPDLAIDINPAKQGKFLAGSGTPVLTSAEAFRRLGSGVDVFVMNSNYLEEIRAMGGPDHHYISVDKT